MNKHINYKYFDGKLTIVNSGSLKFDKDGNQTSKKRPTQICKWKGNILYVARLASFDENIIHTLHVPLEINPFNYCFADSIIFYLDEAKDLYGEYKEHAEICFPQQKLCRFIKNDISHSLTFLEDIYDGTRLAKTMKISVSAKGNTKEFFTKALTDLLGHKIDEKQLSFRS